MRDGRDKAGSPKPKPKDRLTLYKEYRLIERKEGEISGSWKGTFQISHICFLQRTILPTTLRQCELDVSYSSLLKVVTPRGNSFCMTKLRRTILWNSVHLDI